MPQATHTTPVQSPKTQPWIQSPLWDGWWMFSGLWAPILAVLGYLALGAFSVHGQPTVVPFQKLGSFALAYTALSVLHRMSTIYAVLGMPLLRDDIRKNPKRYVYVPLLIFAGCLVLAQAFVFHSAFSFMPTVHSQLWAFFALGYVMIFWERWHFCMQEFGVLSIYRIRSKQFSASDRMFDRVYAVTMMLVINMALFICLGFRDEREVLLFGASLKDHQPLLERIALVAVIAGACSMSLALVREWAHAQRSLPKLGFYCLIGAHTLLLYWFPDAMGLFFFSYVFHHWMVAVGLFNRVTLNSYAAETPFAAALRYLKRVGPFFAVCLLWSMFFDPLDKAGNLTPTPTAMMFEGASGVAKFGCGLVIGSFFAFNYLHYYYDRCFYNFRNPAVRDNVGSLLFASPAQTSASPAPPSAAGA